jgi:hypothetical protein
VLLGRCQMDSDDEVRDRATYFSTILRSADPALNKNYITENTLVSLTLLEKALKDHLNGPLDSVFDLSIIPKTVPVQEEQQHNDVNIKTSGELSYSRTIFQFFLTVVSRFSNTQDTANYPRRSKCRKTTANTGHTAVRSIA